MIPLLRELRRDPALALVTAILIALTLIPLWFTPILPLNDLPDHVGASAILLKALFHQGTPGLFYRVQLTPLPYWTAYVVMVLANAVGGSLFAAKAMVAVVLLLVPLGTMRLLMALGQNPRFGVCAFLMAWDQNLYWGWVSFSLGVALTLFTLAAMLDMRKRRDLLAATTLAVLTALTHILPFGMLLMCGAWIILLAPSSRADRSLLRIDGRIARSIPLVAGVLVLAPWFLHHLGSHGEPPLPAPPALTRGQGAQWIDLSRFGFGWHPIAQKVGSLFIYTLDNIPTAGARQITASVFALVVTLPLIAGGMSQQRRDPRLRRVAFAFFLSMVALYLGSPMEMKHPIEHWYTYPRFGSSVLLFAFAIPAPRLHGRSFAALSCVVIAALAAFIRVTCTQFETFAADVRPLLEVTADVREGSTMLPLVFEDSTTETSLKPLQQVHAYVVARTHGYDPYLYDNDNVPLIYRPETRPTVPPWNHPGDFNLEQSGKAFDYVLVQGPAHTPIKEGWWDNHNGYKLRAARGRWILYERMQR